MRRSRTQKTQIRYLVGAWLVLWAQTIYDFSSTEAERRIDKMSEIVLLGPKDRGLIVNVNEEDIQTLEKYARMLQYHPWGGLSRGRIMINYAMCQHPGSMGSRRMPR